MMFEIEKWELSQVNLSAILEYIQSGAEVLIEDGGKAIARISPIKEDGEAALRDALSRFEPLPEFFWCG